MLDRRVEGSLLAHVNPALVLCTVLVCYVVLFVTYGVTLHPLANLPGPLLVKVTELSTVSVNYR